MGQIPGFAPSDRGSLGSCRSLELRCTCDLLRAYLPMTRNTSATSIKHDHLLRWGGQMYYPEKACNDNYVSGKAARNTVSRWCVSTREFITR